MPAISDDENEFFLPFLENVPLIEPTKVRDVVTINSSGLKDDVR